MSSAEMLTRPSLYYQSHYWSISVQIYQFQKGVLGSSEPGTLYEPIKVPIRSVTSLTLVTVTAHCYPTVSFPQCDPGTQVIHRSFNENVSTFNTVDVSVYVSGRRFLSYGFHQIYLWDYMDQTCEQPESE